MKVFVSQPMKDLTDEQIKDQREIAIEKFRKFWENPNNFKTVEPGKTAPEPEIEMIDSFITDYDGTNPVKFLSRSVDMLADADCAVFAAGWDQARGCRIEHQIAVAYGIKCFYTNDNEAL